MSEYIIAKTAAFLGANGYSYLSLHFLAFAQHYRRRQDRARQPVLAKRGQGVQPGFSRPSRSIDSTRKFSPILEKAYDSYIRGAVDTLLVGLAIISSRIGAWA